MSKRSGTTSKQFWALVDTSGECWEWRGTSKDKSTGYGQFYSNGQRKGAHRVSYELSFGAIPKGMCVCHRCDNPSCVRPSHLFLGTITDNNTDRHTKGRSRGPAGRANANAVLNESQVLQIRERYAHEVPGRRGLAREYGVNISLIDKIVRGEVWKTLPVHDPSSCLICENIGEQIREQRRARMRHVGEQNYNAKLTSADVQRIRSLLNEGHRTQRSIAVEYGVTPSHVSAIYLGKARKSEPEAVAP